MLRKPEAWVRLREHLAAQPDEKFNMGYFWCGTAGCLAGHAVVMEDGKARLGAIENRANEILGLQCWIEADYQSGEEGDYVFGGDWKPGRPLSEITRQEALRYLDKVIEKQDVFVTV